MPDIDAAAARLAALGGAFVKRPNDGTIEGLPFVKNADGYWIEILRADALERPGRV
jgi:lactoylglutathione lyase